MNSRENVLEAHNLVKNFGTFKAVDDISFVVPRGKIIGLLGPNGAGKTTTIHMLLGITTLSSGKISYFGQDFLKNKRGSLQRINFTSSFNTLQGRISAWENLLVFAGLYSVPNAAKKIKELMEYFQISNIGNKRYWYLSAGQRTRINIIKSLINDPELILMDEPTASLDPDIADKTLSLIEDLKKKHNLSILYTSHEMDEVTRICDEVVFLDHGKIVSSGTPIELTKQIKNARLKLMFSKGKKELETYLKEKNQNYEFLSSSAVIIDTEEKLIPKHLFGLGKAGVYVTDIEVIKPTLEDVFLLIARAKKHVSHTH